jgi:cation diffusion facilitator CzcD-associated flavoprotein CzcO
LADGNKSFDDTADIVINASGHLNRWKWPTVPGLHDFQGHLAHSANWDETFSLEGKRVAVLGNGQVVTQVSLSHID